MFCEFRGNMSLGISPDLRFKLEYYGSTQHVFNELELEGHAATCLHAQSAAPF